MEEFYPNYNSIIKYQVKLISLLDPSIERQLKIKKIDSVE